MCGQSRRKICVIDYYSRVERRESVADSLAMRRDGWEDHSRKESVCDPKTSSRGLRRCCGRTTWANGPAPPPVPVEEREDTAHRFQPRCASRELLPWSRALGECCRFP